MAHQVLISYAGEDASAGEAVFSMLESEGYRCWMASERRRNAVPFQAKHYALGQLKKELQRETDPDTIYHLLWQCERIMEAEHREWLRLMIQVEWFG